MKQLVESIWYLSPCFKLAYKCMWSMDMMKILWYCSWHILILRSFEIQKKIEQSGHHLLVSWSCSTWKLIFTCACCANHPAFVHVHVETHRSHYNVFARPMSIAHTNLWEDQSPKYEVILFVKDCLFQVDSISAEDYEL